MKQDFLGDLKLCRDGGNTSSGGRVLVPRKRSLKETVDLWKGMVKHCALTKINSVTVGTE
jgi:hypothetical protein